MNHYPVLKVQFFAGLESHAAVLRFVVGEGALPERVRGEESIAADMPAGAAGIFWVIENRDPELFAVDLAGIIAPVGGLAPNLRFGGLAFGITNDAGRAGNGHVGLSLSLDHLVLLQLGRKADAEAAVLAVAEFRLSYRCKIDLEINDAEFRQIVKRYLARLFDDLHALWIDPIEGRGDAAFLL